MSHLLIDARNAVYRSIFAIKARQNREKLRTGKAPTQHDHYFTVFMRQLVKLIRQYNPDSLHIFWDAPRSTVWRRKILKTYKDRSGSSYTEDISEDLATLTNVSQEFFSVLGVRQYSRKTMEADDLIYAAISVLHPEKTIISSSDSDMIQIPFTYNSSTQYDPGKGKEVVVPIISPVWQKALVGDKADHIDGYYGIGPKKSAALLENRSEFQQYLKVKGARIFYRNLLLIDLSLCPKVLPNQVYVHKRLSESVNFCKDTINKLIMEHKVNGLFQEWHDLIPPFKSLS